MKDSKSELLFHPIRMRIVLALAGRRMTAQELGQALPDVPPATLYRHLKKLTQGGVLAIVEERQVRGALEKCYALPEASAVLSQAELATASKDDHMRYFTTFVSALLGDFWRYLQRDQVDFFADGVGYRQAPLYLDDEEFVRCMMALNAALMPFLAHEPRPGRRRRVLTTIVLPDDEADGKPGTATIHHGGTENTEG